jgi:hypothetical protein
MTRTVVARFRDIQMADRAVGVIKGGKFPMAVNRLRRDGATVMVDMQDESGAARVQEFLEELDPLEVLIDENSKVQTSGGQSETDAASAPANWGDEGGSSQWSQTVLRPDRVADRTVSRDAAPVSGDENPNR